MAAERFGIAKTITVGNFLVAVKAGFVLKEAGQLALHSQGKISLCNLSEKNTESSYICLVFSITFREGLPSKINFLAYWIICSENKVCLCNFKVEDIRLERYEFFIYKFIYELSSQAFAQYGLGKILCQYWS